MDEDGFTLVMTPAQLAAAISGGTLKTGGASDWTRAWGGVKLLFGGLEALGAGGLLLTERSSRGPPARWPAGRCALC